MNKACIGPNLMRKVSFSCLGSNSVLARIEFNTLPEEVTDVVIYSHGFPDSSVLEPNLVIGGSILTASLSAPIQFDSLPENLYISSRVPRKLSGPIMEKPNRAFVCFNSNGIQGSGGDFKSKTLVKDLQDLGDVFAAAEKWFTNASRMWAVGLSTGAFLSLVYAGYCAVPSILPQPFQLYRSGKLAGCVTIGCVYDIPKSYSLDFSPVQIEDMLSIGETQIVRLCLSSL
eukprot:Platyproteum_vivax@DN8872_c0_g1_i1.p1